MDFKQIGRVWTGFVRLSVGTNGGIFLPANHLSTYQEGPAVTLWACVRKMPGSNVGRDAGRSGFMNAATTHTLRIVSFFTVQKTIYCNSTSNAPDDGRMRPKHVELRIHQ